MKEYIACTIAVAVAYIGQRFHALNWQNLQLEEAEFGNFNYTILPIPNVLKYKNKLDLNDIGWPDEFTVFRRETPLELDLSWANSTVRTTRQIEGGKKNSMMCHSHTSKWEHSADVEEHPIQHVLADPGLYASFSSIETETHMRFMEESGIVLAADEPVFMEHAFIGNFKQPAVTAALHAACTAMSMAVQLAGSKTWVFIAPDDYLPHFGGWPTNAGCYPTRMPAANENVGVYLYKAEPGDVVFFPPAWAHAVVTHPGHNVMVNFRSVKPWNLIKYPEMFGMTILTKLFYTGWLSTIDLLTVKALGSEEGGESSQFKPSEALNPGDAVTLTAARKISDVACPDGDPFGADSELVKRALSGEASPIIDF